MKTVLSLTLPALLLLAFAPFSAPARADEEEDTRKEIREVEEAIKAMEAKLADLAAEAAARRKAAHDEALRAEALKAEEAAKAADRLRLGVMREEKDAKDAEDAKALAEITRKRARIVARRLLKSDGAGHFVVLEDGSPELRATIVGGDEPAEVEVYDGLSGARPEVDEAIRSALRALGEKVGTSRGDVTVHTGPVETADLAASIKGLREDVRGLTSEIRELRAMLKETLAR